MSNGPRWPAVGGDLPSLGAMPGRRPGAHVQACTIYVHLNMGAEADQVLGSGAWAVGEPIGAVCEGHGREL